jgi:exopolysaccharide production protein ExoY
MRYVHSEALKRLFDVVFAFLAILILSPLMSIAAVLIAMDGGPILFRHSRIGLHGKTFNCLKFRTMILGASDCLAEYLAYNPDERLEWEANQKLAFDPRATAIGKFMRRTSIDELPQLFNVLFGDMSLVGPRPVTGGELARYGDKSALYLAVRPGITGIWQISGRNDVSYQTRVEMDVRYCREHSLFGDIAILIRTPRAVLARTGAH